MPKANCKTTKKTPDAELIALGRQISEVRKRQRAASDVCGALACARDKASAALDAADAALKAAEAKADAVTDEISALYDRMIAGVPPSTLKGCQAFAKAHVEACWLDEIVVGNSADSYGVAVLLTGLAGLPPT